VSDFDLLISGNLVLHDRVIEQGWIACRDGRIVQLGQGAPPAARSVEDFSGLWVLPGCIDGQIHSSSQAGQEGIGIASRAAAAGGITTFVDMPYDDPQPMTRADLLREKIAIVERDAHIDVALYGTIAPNEEGLNAIEDLIDAGVCAFKFSTFEANATRFPRIDDELLYQAFLRIAPSGLACGVHNQEQEMTRQHIARRTAAGDTGWDAFGRAHPARVEDLATARVFELGAETGAHAHAVHVSTSHGFEIGRMYRAAGYQATVETCVQYLMLNEEEHMRRFGARAKHFPPIRPKAETEKLWRHVAADESVFVSSDHVAWGLERKANPNIFLNAAGGPGLETLLPAFWTGCQERGLAPSLVVRQLCRGPARHFGLAGKGALAAGFDADVTVLVPGQFKYDPARSLSAVKWSAYEGRVFSVRVAATFVRGRMAYNGQQLCNEPGSGRFLRPQALRTQLTQT
jgi:allantoinase